VTQWNRENRRRIIVLRDGLLFPLGTREKLIQENTDYAMQWRKPLSLVEINQMAPTPEVRERKGRP